MRCCRDVAQRAGRERRADRFPEQPASPTRHARPDGGGDPGRRIVCTIHGAVAAQVTSPLPTALTELAGTLLNNAMWRCRNGPAITAMSEPRGGWAEPWA